MPSSRVQMAAMHGADSSSTTRLGRAVRRPLEEQADGSERAELDRARCARPVRRVSDGTRQITSPATPSASRLVTRTRTAGHDDSSRSVRRATPSRRCSALSSMTRVGPASRRWRTTWTVTSTPITVPSTERSGDGLGDLRLLRQRSELHPPRPRRMLVDDVRGRVLSQAGLAAAARTDERDQPMLAEQPGDGRQITVASDQRRECGSAGCGARRRATATAGTAAGCRDGPPGTPARRERGRAGAPNRGRPTRHPASAHQRRRRRRHQDLTSVPARPQPGAADDRQAHVVAAVVQRRRPPCAPPCGPSTTAARRSSGAGRSTAASDRVDGPGEGRHHAVTLTLLDRAHTAAAAIASSRISPWRAIAAAISSRRSCHSRVDPSTSVNRNVTVPAGSANATRLAHRTSIDEERTGDERRAQRHAHSLRRHRRPLHRPNVVGGGRSREDPIDAPSSPARAQPDLTDHLRGDCRSLVKLGWPDTVAVRSAVRTDMRDHDVMVVEATATDHGEGRPEASPAEQPVDGRGQRDDLVGPGSLLAGLTKQVLEAGLEVEIESISATRSMLSGAATTTTHATASGRRRC